eukprot:snap_masked-scaffold_36-processed-gene-0.36-mRNA-1 protein AED:1.00 eAED:1.00 QI:0/0/0/0/1/1/3/0/59
MHKIGRLNSRVSSGERPCAILTLAGSLLGPGSNPHLYFSIGILHVSFVVAFLLLANVFP